MKIGCCKVVWISEKENISISVYGKRYFVHVKVIYDYSFVWRRIRTFEKQSDAINFACKINDMPWIAHC